MVDTLFWMLIGGGAIWFVLTPRKMQPLHLVMHAVVQYLLSLLFWSEYLNTYFTGLLWAFLVLTGLLLWWAPRIPYGRERYLTEMFFRVGQWCLLLGLLIFVAIKSPFFYQMPGIPDHPPVRQGVLFVRPMIKIAGNIFVFTGFFHLVLHGNQQWSIRKSLWDLLPIMGYLGLLGLIRYWQMSLESIPMT